MKIMILYFLINVENSWANSGRAHVLDRMVLNFNQFWYNGTIRLKKGKHDYLNLVSYYYDNARLVKLYLIGIGSRFYCRKCEFYKFILTHSRSLYNLYKSILRWKFSQLMNIFKIFVYSVVQLSMQIKSFCLNC